MSFTEDELQSFNTILEQRLLAHRRDLERTFDQRISEYRRDTEQRLFAMQQEMLRNVTLKLTEFQGRIENIVSEKVSVWPSRLAQSVGGDAEEEPNGNHQLEAIEVQTELPWEDLADVIGQTLDARLTALNDETKRLIDNLEQRLAGRLHGLQDELARSQPHQASQDGDDAALHELLHGIDHLERVIESLQVVMTANHALLSDRLYSHQQQPLERAHPAARLQARISAERGSPTMLSQAHRLPAPSPAPASTNHE